MSIRRFRTRVPAFTGEELGLLGSTHYAEHPPVPLDSTVAMLNMDMVGRLGRDTLIVYGTGTAEEWPTLLADALRAHRPGDTVRVRVLRGDEERAFTAVLGNRADRPRD